MVVARSAQKVSPTFSESEAVEIADRIRCSARKVARGGLNAEGGIVGGEQCELGFRVAVRSASRSP